MSARIAIDPNVRVRGNQTYAGFGDAQGVIPPDMHVEAYESESGLTWSAKITEIDLNRQLIYLAVDWASPWDSA